MPKRTELEFDYTVPDKLMPKLPGEYRGKKRNACKMVILDKLHQSISHKDFNNIFDYLSPGDVVVINNSCMINNVCTGHINDTNAIIYIRSFLPDDRCLINLDYNNLALQIDDKIQIENNLYLTVLSTNNINSTIEVKISNQNQLISVLADTSDWNDCIIDKLTFLANPGAYNSVYATKKGSLQPPSAGLHFVEDTLTKLKNMGVSVVPITLHVAYGSDLITSKFIPENIEEYKIAAEYYQISQETAKIINEARQNNKKIVAIGTTVVRTLETTTLMENGVAVTNPSSGWSELFIYPGYQYKAMNIIFTNLHRPHSSHLMLTIAATGKNLTEQAYREILRLEYEFDLFGDCMLITDVLHQNE